eukprot:Colp12_sorted_trinity150504_noHs@28964
MPYRFLHFCTPMIPVLGFEGELLELGSEPLSLIDDERLLDPVSPSDTTLALRLGGFDGAGDMTPTVWFFLGAPRFLGVLIWCSASKFPTACVGVVGAVRRVGVKVGVLGLLARFSHTLD